MYSGTFWLAPRSPMIMSRLYLVFAFHPKFVAEKEVGCENEIPHSISYSVANKKQAGAWPFASGCHRRTCIVSLRLIAKQQMCLHRLSSWHKTTMQVSLCVLPHYLGTVQLSRKHDNSSACELADVANLLLCWFQTAPPGQTGWRDPRWPLGNDVGIFFLIFFPHPH